MTYELDVALIIITALLVAVVVESTARLRRELAKADLLDENLTPSEGMRRTWMEERDRFP